MTHTSLPWDPSFRSEGADVSASVFYGLGADGTRRRQQELDQDHRPEHRSRRAGLLRLRLEEVGRDHDLASAHQPAPDPIRLPRRSRPGSSPVISSSSCDKIDVLEHRGARRGIPAERAVPRRRGLGSPAAGDAGADRSTGRSASSRSTRSSSREARRHGHARINTIMQTCFFAISGLLPLRRSRSRASRKRSRRPTASADPRSCGATATWWIRRWPICTRSPVPATRSPSHAGRRSSPNAAPDFVQKITAVMLAGQRRSASGQRVSGRRHLAGRRPRSGRSGISRSRFRSGIRRICIQCNQCALVCPHAAIRAKVYDERARQRAADVQVDPLQGNEHKGKQFTIQVAPEDCTGLQPAASTCARPRTAPTRSTRRSTCIRRRRCATTERANYDFFL